MPKQRSPDRDKAFQIYKEHNGNIALVDIAAKLSISEGTIRGWKAKDKWEQQLNGTFQKDVKRSIKNMERSKQLAKKSKAVTKKLLETVEGNDSLTEKQKLFCVYFLKNHNATQAAINAGYSPDTSGQIGYNLLHRDDIRKEIDRLRKIRNKALILDENDIVERYMTIAFSDMKDFLNFGVDTVLGKDGIERKYNFVHLKDSRMVDGALISEISVGKNGAKIKLEDRQKALDWLDKHFLMNPLDKYKIEYDNKKLEYERLKVQSENNQDNSDSNTKITIYIPDNKRDSDG